jgi:hypothetical protein
MINVKVIWEGKKEVDNLIRYLQNVPFIRVEGELEKLADDVVKNMKETINTERLNPARPDHKLENSLDWEVISKDPGKRLIIGIANIGKMIQEAPHFELIDAGGTYVTRSTHVVPTEYFADPGSGFITFKEGSSHTITGIGYFSKAEEYLSKNLDIIVEKLVNEYMSKL